MEENNQTGEVTESQSLDRIATNSPVPGSKLTDGPKPASDAAQSSANIADSLPKRSDSGPLRPSDVAKRHPEHHAKTVHLPPKEVQEERMRARRQSREEFRAAAAKEAEAQPVESASSPTSTVGAGSAATPVPADPSPVTSVGGEEAASKRDLSPVLPSDDAVKKQEHDRLLDAQKELARREILGPDLDSDSPDVQLRLEQEQAAKASREAAAAAPSGEDAVNHLRARELQNRMKDLQDADGHDSAASGSAMSSNNATASSVGKNAANSSEALDREMPAPAIPVSKSTPNGTPSATRMTTRVSSGSMRQKSVSEIIGESPRPPSSSNKRASAAGITKTADPSKTTSTSTAALPRRENSKFEPNYGLGKEEMSLRHDSLPVSCEGYEKLRGAAEDPSRDYLEPLFKMQTHDGLPINKTLVELLTRANKVVSTADQFAGIQERQDYKLLRRVYQLQNANKWALRQMLPCTEPEPPKTHMDHLLAEMKWMRTDFRAERKNKKLLARFYAEECVAWVEADTMVRASMQVKVKKFDDAKPFSNAPHSPADTNIENAGRSSQDATSPPELEPAYEHDDASLDEMDEPRTPRYYVAPSSIFPAMNIDKDTIQHIDTAHFFGCLNELPLYSAFDARPVTPDRLTQRRVPPVSRFCEEKMMIPVPEPMHKRSRFDYSEDDDDDDVIPREPSAKRLKAKDGAGITPEQTDVSLFDPLNKLLRDRLHSNTAFRPPSEFPMPSSQFYEYRTGSLWIAEDDQLLRRLAKDYSFNWSLIADEMALPSKLAGAGDRRTPWECFERWVELESLPVEMKKTVYFKTWNQRLEVAQKNNEQRYQNSLANAAAQSANTNPTPTVQRRRTVPSRVERRRTNRYLHVVDAMRKNARKREQHAHKQAEGEINPDLDDMPACSLTRFIAQKAASLRKQHENSAPKSSMHSPAEFSRIRHERDVQHAQRQEQYRLQVLERQRQAAVQARGGQVGGQQHAHGAVNQQRPPNGVPQPPNAQQMHHAGNNNQMQPGQQGQAPRVGNVPHAGGPQIAMHASIPQAQMAPNMRASINGQPNHVSSDSMQQQRMALEQARHQAQMKQQAQMNGGNQQFQMGPPNRASPAGGQVANGMMNGQQNSAAMMAAMQQSNTPRSPMPNGTPMQQNYNIRPNSTATSASPHMPPPPTPASSQQQAQQSGQQPQQLSSGHIPAIHQITHQLQAKHPNATAEQIKELTSQHLKFYSQQQNQARQSALQAAAGPHGMAPSPNNQTPYNNQNGQLPNQNHAAFQQNNTIAAAAPNGHAHNSMQQQQQQNGHASFVNSSPATAAAVVGQSPSNQNQYAAAMRQQLIQQRQSQIQSAAVQAVTNGSPRPGQAQASPNVVAQQHAASPNLGQVVPNMNGAGGGPQQVQVQQNRTQQQQQQQQQPQTPQMTRLGSSNGQGAGGSTGQSPGMQKGSPRAVPAGVAQRQ